MVIFYAGKTDKPQEKWNHYRHIITKVVRKVNQFENK